MNAKKLIIGGLVFFGYFLGSMILYRKATPVRNFVESI